MKYLFVCFMLVSGLLHGYAQEPDWRYSAGGRISAIQAEGPDGSIYLVSENRALHSLNPNTGVQNWFLRPGGKLQPYITVGPECTIYILNRSKQLFAINQGGYIRWKKQLDSNILCSPAVNQKGELILLLENGNLLCFDRRGKELWSSHISGLISLPPVLDSKGRIYLSDSEGNLTVLGRDGKIIRSIPLQDIPSVLIRDDERSCILVGTQFGSVYAIDEDGNIFWDWQEEQGERIAFILQTGNIYYISYSSGNLYKVESGTHTELMEKLPHPGGVGALDNRDQLIYPTANGRLLIVGQGSQSQIDNDAVLTAPLLSHSGILVTGGDDWVLYGYKWSSPAAGWTQYLSSPRRNSQSGHSPFNLHKDDKLFRNQPEYVFFSRLIQNGNIEDVSKVLTELKIQILEKKEEERAPYTDLLLYKLISTGQTASWGKGPGKGGLYDTALIRSEAYLLIAQLDDYRYRSLLLPLLKNEQDTTALSRGFEALGAIGVDYDGKAVRLISDKITHTNILDDRLAISAINAINNIYTYNGYMTDDSGYFILDYLLKAPLSGSVKKYVMEVFKSLL